MYIFQMIDGLSTGGAEELQVTFAIEANRRGFKLAVISLDEAVDSQYAKQLHALGAAVYFFPTNRIFDFNNLYRITELLQAERPDILHAHLTYSTIIGSMVAWLTRVPVVATLHATGIDERFRAPRTELVEKFALRHLVHKIIACGPCEILSDNHQGFARSCDSKCRGRCAANLFFRARRFKKRNGRRLGSFHHYFCGASCSSKGF